jgi:hypothetical protein
MSGTFEKELIDLGNGTFLVKRWSNAYSQLSKKGWVIYSEYANNFVVMRAYE